MRFSSRLGIFMILAFHLSVPFAAIKGAGQAQYAELSDAELLNALSLVNAKESADVCKELSPILAEMVTRGSFPEQIVKASAAAEMWCAREQGRWQDAYRYMLVAEEGVEPLGFGALGFGIAIYAGHYDDALDRLLAIAESEDPKEAFSLYIEDVLFLMDKLRDDGSEKSTRRMLDGLFHSPHFNQFSPRLQGPIAYALLDSDADRGDFAHADEKLAYLKYPPTYIYLLADRKFAPIWPALESKVGKNMRTVVDSYLAETQARYKSNPKDDNALQGYAHALLFAGRPEDVVALVDVDDIGSMNENQGWALNVKAYALDALGRHAEAEAVFDAIAKIPYRPGVNEWLVSFLINRASYLSELGLFEKALAANRLAESLPASEYANMLTLKTNICSLAGLGRSAEVEPYLKLIYDKRRDSYDIAALAALCVGDVDRAARIVLEALADPKSSGDMAEDLQPEGFSLFYSRSHLPTLYEKLHAYNGISQALDKAGRFIPDEYMPEAGIRRTQADK